MPANAEPAEDGARETELPTSPEVDKAEDALKAVIREQVGSSMWMPWALRLASAGIAYRRAQHAATLAHLAQQADGETALAEILDRALDAAATHALVAKDACFSKDPDAVAAMQRCAAERDTARTALLANVAGQAARHREAERRADEELDQEGRYWAKRLEQEQEESRVALRRPEAEVARLRARLAEAKRWLVMCQASMMSPRHFEFVANALTEIRKGATA